MLRVNKSRLRWHYVSGCNCSATEFEILRKKNQNGIEQFRAICHCTGFHPIGGAIHHSTLSDGEKKSARESRDGFGASVVNAACERCGDGDSGVELHHWAPVSIFDDAEKWPTSWLCKKCHGEWHRKMKAAAGRAG